MDLPGSGDASSLCTLSAKVLLRSLAPSMRSEVDNIIEGISSSKRKLLAPEIAPLRAIKSQAEQRVMNEAGAISGRAHAKVGYESTVMSKANGVGRLCASRNQGCQKLL